jgi:uncharacterized protein (DUF58 family)
LNTTVPSARLGSAQEVLRRLDLTVSRRLDGLLQGDYRGLIPGHGSELGEAREYVAGDDTRRIDWNVTARMSAVHVRETIADRELEVWLLVDLSASLAFGTADCEKRDLAIAGAAAVGFLTARSGNRFGAVVLTTGGLTMVPARTGRAHLQSVLYRLVSAPRTEGGGPTDLRVGIERLDRLARRRGLCVVVSDFLAAGDWTAPLGRLATRHEALAIEVVDPRELELPNVGVLSVVDPETGDHREIQTASAKLRARYAEAAAAQRTGIARSIREAGVDHLVLRTDRDWLRDIVKFVQLRRQRMEDVRRVKP